MAQYFVVWRHIVCVTFLLLTRSLQIKNPRRSQGLVEEAVDTFVRMENWDGLAILFAQLPSGVSVRERYLMQRAMSKLSAKCPNAEGLEKCKFLETSGI